VKSMYGGVDDYTINGSVVSFQYTDTENVNAQGAYNEFEKAPSYAAETLDDGVIYMYDIALHTRDYYENEAALR